MAETIAEWGDEAHSAVRDSGWQAEVDRETMRAVVEREVASLPASLLAWLVLVIAAIPLPHFKLLLLPLAFRLVSVFATSYANHRVRLALEARKDAKRELAWLTAALGIAGISWAALLYPHIMVVMLNPSAVAMRGIAVIGVGMLAVTYGPLKFPMFALLAGFGLTLASFVLINSPHYRFGLLQPSPRS